MASRVHDDRWTLLRDDVAAAVADLAAGADLYETELREEAPPRLRLMREKAFQKFLQDGYASLEAAMKRALQLYGGVLPSGGSWHADLVALTTAPGAEGRPAFAPDLARDIRRLLQFRHFAVHGYMRFEAEDAAPAAAAARRVAAALPAAAEAFGRAAGLLSEDPPSAK
jgi:hypothetical protein